MMNIKLLKLELEHNHDSKKFCKPEPRMRGPQAAGSLAGWDRDPRRKPCAGPPGDRPRVARGQARGSRAGENLNPTTRAGTRSAARSLTVTESG
eukprot:3937742-Rhodomonas_salina.5